MADGATQRASRLEKRGKGGLGGAERKENSYSAVFSERASWRVEDGALRKQPVAVFSDRARRRVGGINFTEKNHQTRHFCYFLGDAKK